ncbi:MAG: hypothetical protein GTN40_03065 [Candidatus Aenigmarchaeota archaeon]|nr:hypothetical protein [Candidatus Aenigmarchaeota archaeon]
MDLTHIIGEANHLVNILKAGGENSLDYARRFVDRHEALLDIVPELKELSKIVKNSS